MMNVLQPQLKRTITLASGRAPILSLTGQRWSLGEVGVCFEQDGSLRFEGVAGAPLSAGELIVFRRRQSAAIMDLLYHAAATINEGVESFAHIHRGAPALCGVARERAPYPEPIPEAPVLTPAPDLFSRLIRPTDAAMIDRRNLVVLAAHHARLEAWRDAFHLHEETQDRFLASVEGALAGDQDATDLVFSELLRRLDWPHETRAAFTTRDAALSASIELASLCEFPGVRAEVSPTDMKVSLRCIGDVKKRALYVSYVHGAILRVASEAFRLPCVETVIASGLASARDDEGGSDARCIISVRFNRAQWEQLDVRDLHNLDPAEALSRFELRRKMLVGSFAEIEPFMLDYSENPRLDNVA